MGTDALLLASFPNVLRVLNGPGRVYSLKHTDFSVSILLPILLCFVFALFAIEDPVYRTAFSIAIPNVDIRGIANVVKKSKPEPTSNDWSPSGVERFIACGSNDITGMFNENTFLEY